FRSPRFSERLAAYPRGDLRQANRALREAPQSQKQPLRPAKQRISAGGDGSVLMRKPFRRHSASSLSFSRAKFAFRSKPFHNRSKPMVRPLLKRRKRAKPQNHVDMRLGDGWHKRNFLSEVVIPSLFTKRQGRKIKPVFPELAPGKICITWIGHASFLIQTPEHSVLIDPNWAKWLKVIKRIKHPGIELRDLPAIDLVLVTHAHFDHLDRRTLRAIACDQPIAVPEHVGNLVHDLGFNRIHELRHSQSFEHGTLKVTLPPARHWGARILPPRHRGFGGFLLEYAGRTIFHCGDTAYFG